MAPKKQDAKAKTKAKAKPTPKATGKKRNPSPPVAPDPKAGVRVKTEPGTAPDPAIAGSASSSSGGLGVDRGTISKLLTSLKYQLKSQQNSEQQKADAQSVLNRYMDPDSTLEEKKHILQKLVTGGVRNCSWVHSMSVSTEAQEVESERVMANMLTRRVRSSFLFF